MAETERKDNWPRWLFGVWIVLAVIAGVLAIIGVFVVSWLSVLGVGNVAYTDNDPVLAGFTTFVMLGLLSLAVAAVSGRTL